ncbi:MAG TPA: hypothetical protein VHO69_03520 [Phototrophicaceae bacterium]|nr:hypothetical protein [Phototrophicaceae bacterium]
MNTEFMNLLLHLDEARQAGQAWVSLSDEFPRHIRRILVNNGLITARGKTSAREYRITEVGQRAMVTTELPETPPQPATPAASTPLQEGEERFIPAAGPVITKHPEACAAGCTCAYRLALDIVAARLPEVRELVAAIKKVQGVAQ